MRRKWMLFGGLALLWIMGSDVFPSHSLEESVFLSDDAYHYRDFADGQHDRNYIEWWYFNLYDTVQDIQTIFGYSIIDPEDYSGLGQAIVGAVAYTAEGIVSESDTFSTESFSASYEQADVEIEANAIEVIDHDTYRIVGSIGGGRLSWDLTYVRQANSWFGGDREEVGLFPWEQMSWLIYMPGAEVSGEVKVDGQSYTLRAVRGYHDHNWGEWIPSNALWNWAQYFEPGLALEMGDFINRPAGIMSVEFQGKRATFLKDQYHLIHTRWTVEEEDCDLFPIKTWLYAENDSNRVLLSMKAYETEALQMDTPLPLPDVVIHEQTAHYEGLIWEKNSLGQWELLVSFSGDGFKEYTSRKWDSSRGLAP
ncbi:MAG: hypothetical protein GTN74_03700 [Proteobacteria bacterium]|nr:hypothetical protein [Pseudomonadota bacterium]NIS68395.1 hypothetical protein [Pseudomonadota bacterium]